MQVSDDWFIELTVADHEANEFITTGEGISFEDEASARSFLGQIENIPSDPDRDVDYILDLKTVDGIHDDRRVSVSTLELVTGAPPKSVEEYRESDAHQARLQMYRDWQTKKRAEVIRG